MDQTYCRQLVKPCLAFFKARQQNHDSTSDSHRVWEIIIKNKMINHAKRQGNVNQDQKPEEKLLNNSRSKNSGDDRIIQ